MAEIIVENRICNACGADVRPDTLFCYNCGSSVAPEVVVALKDKENIAEEANGNKPATVAQSAVEEVTDAPVPKPIVQEKTELKSAAAMRRKAKTFQPKRIETVWEEHNNAPNGWFILAAILLTLLAVGLFWLAIYLK